MASSGVWENIHLSKTPTLDGVCGILSFIIIFNFDYLPNNFCLFCWQMVSQLVYIIIYDRCCCHIILNQQTNIQKALTACKYPNWEINRMKLKIDAPKTRQNNKNNRTIYRSHITVPYNEGLSESMKNIGQKYGIQVHFKGGKTLKMNQWLQKTKTTWPTKVA